MSIIRVKYLSKGPCNDLATAGGGKARRVGNCEFVFHRDIRDYDWLVAYDDLPGSGGADGGEWEEVLACPPSRTLLLTVEPSSIKVYGRVFLRQFAWVLTSHEPWAVAHPGAIRCQPGLARFYEGDEAFIKAHPPENKTALISTVCSSKQQRHTLHRARYVFTQKLKAALPELEVYGHGVRPMKQKNEALDAYKYHVCIENHVGPHHVTEKLSDAFLGMCLPFYHGAPNAAEYYPKDSFIPIDIHRFDEALATIKAAIANGEYERRLPALREARTLALEKWATFPQLARLIEERHGRPCHADGWTNRSIMNRHLLRRRSMPAALWQAWDTTWMRARFLLQNGLR